MQMGNLDVQFTCVLANAYLNLGYFQNALGKFFFASSILALRVPNKNL